MTKTSFPTPSRPYLYLPDGWDTGWKAAKAAIATTPAGILFWGDSLTSGYNASNFATKSFPGLIRASLAATYPVFGDFYSVAYDLGHVAINGTPPFAVTATANITRSIGIGYGVMDTMTGVVAFGTTGDLVYTSPYACTAFDIIGYDNVNSASTWKYNIDNAGGTGLVTVSPSGFQGTAYRVAVTGQTNAIHTVRMGGTSNASFDGVTGVISYVPAATGGFLFSFEGNSGISTAVTSTNWQSWQGYYKTTSSDTTHPTGFGYPANNSLVIIQMGINDCSGQFAQDGFFLILKKYIQGVRRAVPNCSIILLGSPNFDPESSDTTTRFGFSTNWPMYLAMMRQLADAYNCAFINIHAKWGETPVAQGFLGAGDAHPNDAGYADIASSILGVL